MSELEPEVIEVEWIKHHTNKLYVNDVFSLKIPQQKQTFKLQEIGFSANAQHSLKVRDDIKMNELNYTIHILQALKADVIEVNVKMTNGMSTHIEKYTIEIFEPEIRPERFITSSSEGLSLTNPET